MGLMKRCLSLINADKQIIYWHKASDKPTTDLNHYFLDENGDYVYYYPKFDMWIDNYDNKVNVKYWCYRPRKET